MIAQDQPTIFGSLVTAVLSSRSDGTMKLTPEHHDDVIANRDAFLRLIRMSLEQTILVPVSYNTENFTKFRIVSLKDGGDGMRTVTSRRADALVTSDPHVALFLPLADCAGVVLYDRQHKVLMVSHLGRHSVEQWGAVKSVDYLKHHFSTDPSQLLVWISPSVGKASYPLRVFNGKGLQEVILEQLHESDVPEKNIEASHIDTAHDRNYYSHSEFLKGNRDEPGRFAIAARINEYLDEILVS
jgi:hypothetical protein